MGGRSPVDARRGNAHESDVAARLTSQAKTNCQRYCRSSPKVPSDRLNLMPDKPSIRSQGLRKAGRGRNRTSSFFSSFGTSTRGTHEFIKCEAQTKWRSMRCDPNRLGLLRALCPIHRFAHATVAGEEADGVRDGKPIAAVPALPQAIILHWHGAAPACASTSPRGGTARDGAIVSYYTLLGYCARI